jgi:hypothetical protein
VHGELGEVRAALTVVELGQGEVELWGGFRGTSTATSGGSIRASEISGRLERCAWIGFCSMLERAHYISCTRLRNLAHALIFFPRAIFYGVCWSAVFFFL